MGEEEYKWTMSDELAEMALRELREDKSTREFALKQMREWVRQNQNISNVRTDANFLLRFLRVKKYSIPMAQEMLERFVTAQQEYPHWFGNLDCLDPKISELIDAGFAFPLRGKDESGRTVVISRGCVLDPHRHTASQMARVHAMTIATLMRDEENHIRGFTYINDEKGITASHLTIWSISDVIKIKKVVEQSFPVRHKSTNMVNLPPLANKTVEFFISLHNEKMRNRIRLHANLDQLKQHFNPKILPKEYGGEVPIAELIADWKRKLLEGREELLQFDKMRIHTLRKPEKEDNEFSSIMGVSGSFRKLELD